MPLDQRKLVLNQIATLSSIISERGLAFTEYPQSDLDELSLGELERVRKAYHELAYSPPIK